MTSTGNLAEGAIKSPNFPNDYPNNKDQVHFRKPESIFSCEGAALEVLMYVCPSVRVQFEILRFQKVLEDSRPSQ